MILDHRVHVLGRKEDIDAVRVPGKVALVLDVLFATSTTATALAHRAAAVIPALDEAAARAEGARHAKGAVVLAGELYADTLPGFAPPTPLALVEHGVGGKQVIYSTTNGTIALHAAAGARAVYAAALLNGRAVVEHALRAHPDATVLIVCAGSMGNFNLEDFVGAGYLVELLVERLGAHADLSDAARAARTLFRAGDPLAALVESRVGRMMIERGLRHEVEYAAQRSVLEVVPHLSGSRIVAV